MGNRYYLAYGSNLNKEQMSVRCPGAVPVGTCCLEGYRLVYRGSRTGSYLTIEKAKGYYVPVAVWRVTAAHEAALDRYEGYPAFYRKVELHLHMVAKKGGKETDDIGFVYIMDANRPYGLPSPYYIDVCATGYDDFGFDLAVLDKAYDDTAELIANSEVSKEEFYNE